MRAVVIGAGVIGLMCAYQLRKRGAEVVILDKGQPGGVCSLGNAGWVVPSMSLPLPAPGLALTFLKSMLSPNSPMQIEAQSPVPLTGWLWSFWRHCTERDYNAGVAALAGLNRNTMALYDELERDGIACEMQRAGVLFLFRSESAMRHALEGLTIQAPQPLQGAALRELEPAVSNAAAAGFLVKEDRHLRPESLMAGLTTWLTSQGVELQADREVLGGVRTGNRLSAIATSRGVVAGDRFVIASGAWSGQLAKRFGFDLPMQAGKGYSITVANPGIKLRHPTYLHEAKVACSPFPGVLRLTGAMDLSGLNQKMHARRIAAIWRGAGKYFQDWGPCDGQSEWMGLRPLTPDGLPAIGRAPGFENLYVATGHQMLGVTLAPATAAALADLIYNGRTHFDMSAFDPGRFSDSRAMVA